MILIHTYPAGGGSWTGYSSAWTFGAVTGPYDQTSISFFWQGGGYSITLNQQRGNVETFLRDNVDSKGFCDIRPLQQ